MRWHIVDSGSDHAAQNMAKDHYLLLKLDENSSPILHCYDWIDPSATYGYFIKPENYLDLEKTAKNGWQLARRSTGGGIIFHAYDFAFSMLVPASHPKFSVNTLDNYAFINNMIIEVIKRYTGGKLSPSLQSEEIEKKEICEKFCMAKPTIYDIMIDGKKVGGAAQRRTRKGFLHQGSIALTLPEEDVMREIFLPDVRSELIQAMQKSSYALLGKASYRELSAARCQLKELLIDHVANQLV